MTLVYVGIVWDYRDSIYKAKWSYISAHERVCVHFTAYFSLVHVTGSSTINIYHRKVIHYSNIDIKLDVWIYK